MLLVFTALTSEAKPLIEHFRLKLIEDAPFRMYEGAGMRLLVTGVKKIFMASGVSYLAAKTPTFSSFLNIGIAGHKTKEIGSVLLVDQIKDPVLKKTFYPHIFIDKETEPVLTIDNLLEEYPENTLLDMESSAFYSTALRFTTCEKIQILKIVSDNEKTPFTGITKEKTQLLLQSALPEIEEVMQEMQRFSPQKPKDFSPLFARVPFTAFQKNRFYELIQYLEALAKPLGSFEKFSRAKHILEHLEKAIDL